MFTAILELDLLQLFAECILKKNVAATNLVALHFCIKLS